MIPPSSSKPMDAEATAEALAWAQLWDSSDVLTNLKLQVHTAVGLELKKIPLVKEQALNLKSKVFFLFFLFFPFISFFYFIFKSVQIQQHNKILPIR
jgi:hypothetical protein